MANGFMLRTFSSSGAKDMVLFVLTIFPPTEPGFDEIYTSRLIAIFSMLKQRKGTSTFASFTLACGCHIRRRWFLFQGSRNILIHLRPWYKRLNGTCGARSSCPCTETWNRAKRK